MYRAELITDRRNPLDRTLAAVSTFPTRLETALVDDLNRTVVPNLEAGLSYEPPQRKTYRFSTPKSRRWYFWAIGKGMIPTANGHYLRSHKLSKGYTVRVIAADGAVVLSVRNPAKKAYRWVASKQQTIGHKLNGWIPAAQPINYWAQVAKERVPIVAGQVARALF